MKKDLWVYMLIVFLIWAFASCEVTDRELGEDLLPPGDSVFLYHDTIFDINAYPVTSRRIGTSDRSFNPNTLWLLGESTDTITGRARASLVTQFNTTSQFINGPNMEIDSLVLYLYMDSFVGDVENQITLRVYEMTERIFMDSMYYSDYEIEGKYNPVQLAQYTFLPENASTQAILIEDQDYLNKFLTVQTDTSYFRNDSVFKDYFKGFYMTAESGSADELFARVGLSNSLSRLAINYANDSTEIDSTEERDFKWANFTINEFASQKINIFEHDFSGTYLSTIIDSESANSPYCYVQGMAGVNTFLSFDFIQDWMDKAPIAINSANLIFNILPEKESGIPYDDLPERLMLYTQLDNGNLQSLYDEVILYGNIGNDELFGGYRKAVSKSMFSDTSYVYSFNINLHLQAMVDGEKADPNFILRLANPIQNPEVSKLWSNLPTNDKRIRLELVYLKL